MRCKKIEKWISDKLDGRLLEGKKKILEAHLRKCASCRSYARNLEMIHKKAQRLEAPTVSPDYWKDFDLRLKTKISSWKQEERRRAPFFLRWRWAWAAAALAFVIAVISFFYLDQINATQEVYVFSFEDAYERIYNEISNDPELEKLFNSVILASVGENLVDSEMIMDADIYESPFLLEDLTEEEIGFIESEIEKEIKK